MTAGSLLIARAQVKLDQYIAAEQAYSNINASAAASYSDVRGTVSKRVIDEARAQADQLLEELSQLLLIGGVEIQTENGIAYWSLGL